MSIFQPRSFQQILANQVSTLSANTAISDFSNGSVILTILEAAAQEDFNQYVQMVNILRNINLDTTEGTDLDDRAAEFLLTRLEELPHSGFVNIFDNSFTKISTGIFAGAPGPTSGSTIVQVDDASLFPPTGQIFVGRGTANSEGPISYSAAPVDNTSFWTITLDTALLNDHGTDETIVLSQGGNRLINAGEEVEIPETDVNARVAFEVNQTVTILDGEDTIENVLVTAVESGGFAVPANSIITFANPPFAGASVTNPLPFTNGRFEETDQELRDRIRDTIQSLSRGTRLAVTNEIIGLVDPETNSSVTSSSLITPVEVGDGPSQLFIDNGRGLEPSFSSIGLETVLSEATGGEQFFQLQNFPLVRASVVSQNVERFNLNGGETLVFKVGTEEETFTFQESDFELLGNATASEVSEAVNNRSTLVEARTITTPEGIRVIITSRARVNEALQIDSASTAQEAFNFPEMLVESLRLYKNDQLLTKDGLTASLISLTQPFNLNTESFTTTDSDITVTPGSRIVTKTAVNSDDFQELVHPGDYIRFESDIDSFFVRVRTVVSPTRFILETPYLAAGGGTGDIVIWNSPQLEVAANGDINETEVISFAPFDFANPIQALASEVFSRIDTELNLSTVDLVVNDTRLNLISNLENSAESRMQVTGGGAALALGYSTTTQLSGFANFTAGSTTVTGAGTSFLSELQEGQWIKADADNNGAWTKIETIESDSVLYLVEDYRGRNRIGETLSSINFSAISEGANRDYILNFSNGMLEIINPLVPGDNLTAGSINTRAFLDSLPETFDFDSLGSTSELIVCIDGGFEGNVTSADVIPPFNNFVDSNLIGFEASLFNNFFIEWVTGDNAGETGRVNFYNSATGEFTTTSFSNPIQVGDKFTLCQTITIDHISSFVDPENALAQEVINAINSSILGGQAELLPSNRVRLRTSNFSSGGSIQIKGGSANDILAFSNELQTNQDTNLAFLTSQNSDRMGDQDALGFTLGPNQNLVVIFDEENGTRTFSVPMFVDGEVVAGGSNSFVDSNLASLFPEDGFFNNFWIYWTSGANEGVVQTVESHVGNTATFTTSTIFPTTTGIVSISAGDTFSLVPRTAENIKTLLNNFNNTTLSIVGDVEVTGISGDFVQISTKTPGSDGAVFVTGGTSNSIAITIQGIPAGGNINDVNVNATSGLSKGLFVSLTVDGIITVGDSNTPFNTFIVDSFVSAFPNVFTGLQVEFLSGNNSGFTTTVDSYNNLTGEIVLAANTPNAILPGDSIRIFRDAYVSNISGSSSPFTVELVNEDGTVFDVSAFSPERQSAIRDKNGLNFSNIPVVGVDGYRFFTGLIQQVQFTIDGLDSDPDNFPGIAAAGTQFEVLTPVFVQLRLIVDITTEEGITLSSINNEVSNAILEYVSNLEVGDDVILSEIIAAAQSVVGVFDVNITNLTDNVVIADNELAVLSASNLVLG